MGRTMSLIIVILITFLVAFWLGSLYGKTHYRHRGKFLKRLLVTVFAVMFSILALVGFIGFLSPMLFFSLIEKLPPDTQEWVVMDLIFRGGTGVWIFAIIAGVLWWFRTRI